MMRNSQNVIPSQAMSLPGDDYEPYNGGEEMEEAAYEQRLRDWLDQRDCTELDEEIWEARQRAVADWIE